jgi:actin-related protein
MALVLPSTFPLPLLSTLLDNLFNNFHPPNISLMSSPMLTTFAAGLRSALVVDIGWAETVVTSIYEYREVQCKRSTRACKLLGEEMFKMLVGAINPFALKDTSEPGSDTDEISQVLSFEECEDILTRMAWCKSATKRFDSENHQGLATVKEEDEFRSSMHSMNLRGTLEDDPVVSIPLTSTTPPRTLPLSFSKLAEPCETALFASENLSRDFDDEELPIHLLVYHSLLQLPVDIRTMCMARIVFVGGGSKVLGLKQRVINELSSLVVCYGWDPVRGKRVDEFRNNSKLRNKRTNTGPTVIISPIDENGAPRPNAAMAKQEHDPIEDKLRKEAIKDRQPTEQGFLRAVDSLGAWSGGSLLQKLKIPVVSVVDREQWQMHGVAGSSRDPDVTINATTKRQSMVAALKSGNVEKQSWTLGPWG